MPIPDLSDTLSKAATFNKVLKTAMGEPGILKPDAFLINSMPMFMPHIHKSAIGDLDTMANHTGGLIIDSLTIFDEPEDVGTVNVLTEKEYIKSLIDKPSHNTKIVYSCGPYEISTKYISSSIVDMDRFSKHLQADVPTELVPISTVNPFISSKRLKEVVVKPYGQGKHYQANQEGRQVAIAKRRAARKRNKQKNK